MLFDSEGFSHGEIAEMLGIPVGTVRSVSFTRGGRCVRLRLSSPEVIREPGNSIFRACMPDPEIGALLRSHLEAAGAFCPSSHGGGCRKRSRWIAGEVLAPVGPTGNRGGGDPTSGSPRCMAGSSRRSDAVGEPLLELSTAADGELILTAMIPEP